MHALQNDRQLNSRLCSNLACDHWKGRNVCHVKCTASFNFTDARRNLWRSIQHNNTTALSRFLFFWNFTTGRTGSNMFCRISQNCTQIFRSNLLYGRGGHLTLFWKKKNRGFFVKIWHFGPFEVTHYWRQAPPRLRPCRVFQKSDNPVSILR